MTPDLSANKPAIAEKINGVEILKVEFNKEAKSAKISTKLPFLYLIYLQKNFLSEV